MKVNLPEIHVGQISCNQVSPASAQQRRRPEITEPQDLESAFDEMHVLCAAAILQSVQYPRT